MNDDRITPDWIETLAADEIFVFGSNLQGLHGGGAARLAHAVFGARWGVGAGPTGRCYAIPTMQGGVETIRPYVEDFIDYAARHPENRFLVTEIGCGIAGCSMSVSALKFQSDRVPGISVSRPCVRSRYWLGVIPVFFLKAMLKCDAYSNPLSNAIS